MTLLNPIDLTRELVAIPSVNPGSAGDGKPGAGEAAMADRVESILRKLGATQIERWEPRPGRPSVTGYFDFGAAETLIFDAHLDTVPVAGMTVDPFRGEVRDGRIYGRGACDVKGPMAAMLCALDNVRRAAGTGGKGRARYNVLFAAVCDEEAGFSGVSSFVERLEQNDRGAGRYAPIVGAVVAEPTLLNPVVAHKGTARWVISTAGIAAHSSTPELGRNAIYAMALVVQTLEVYAAELRQRDGHARLGTPTSSVGIVRGGSAANIVPDHCEIHVDRRLVPGETPESARKELERVLAGLDVLISESIVAAPPMETAEDAPLAQAALAAARTAGAKPEFEYANYCTDASFYPRIGVPTVVFGPGSIAQAHTKDEWIATDQLEMGVRAYEAVVLGAENELTN